MTTTVLTSDCLFDDLIGLTILRELPKPMSPSQQTGIPRIWIVAGLFTLLALTLQAWRSWVLLASYDQGIFQQVLWNSLHGHWFESTLSSQLSTNVIHAGELPSVDYERLGQHFTSTLLLWAPLLCLLGRAALPLVKVGMISSAGLVLHRLVQGLLPHRTAYWMATAISQ